MTALSIFKKHGLPLSLYLLGSAALFFADILVTASVSDRQAGEWGNFRSIIAIGSVFCIVGLDQVFVRRPEHSKAIIIRLIIQLPIMTALCAAIVAYMNIGISPAAAAIVLLSAATSLSIFGFLRSHRLLVQAQLAHHGWKIIAFFLLVLFTTLGREVNIATIISISTLGAAFMVLGMLWQQRKLVSTTTKVVAHDDDIFRVGKRFFLSSQLLAIALWGEQILITKLGNLELGGLYFSTKAIFIFPIALLTGYIAFLLGPFVRDQQERFFSILKGRWWIGIILVVSVTGLIHVMGQIAWSVLKPDTPLWIGPAVLFSFAAAVQTLYIIPSSYLGVYATTRTHDLFIILQMISLMITGIIFVFFLKTSLSLPLAVASAGIINLLLRFLAASMCMWITRVKIKETQPE